MSADPSGSIVAGFGVRRPREARSANAGAVLRYLLAHGPTSRVDLAAGLGLTQGPVTRIVALLLELGLVHEGDAQPVNSGRGRPRVPVAMNPDAWHTISAHLGVMQVTLSRVDLSGKVVQELRAEHDGAPESVVRITAELCARLAEIHPAPVLGVGAVTGGWIDAGNGIVRKHEGLQWVDVPVRKMLSEAIGRTIYVDSAVRSHAVADMVYGPAVGERDFLHVFLGNVIEVALVVEGRVRTGLEGFGGDLSAWLLADEDGRAVRAIDMVSDYAVRAVARREGILGPTGTFEELVEIAESATGDSCRAQELLVERAQRAARLVAGVATMVSPAAVVVSSGVVATRPAIEGLVVEYERLMDGYPRPPLEVSPHWRTPLATAGAALVVEQALLANPLVAMGDVAGDRRTAP